MNLDQAAGMVKVRCGNIPHLEAKVLDLLEFEKAFTLEQDAGFLPWFLKRTETLILPAGETSLQLPIGFLGISLQFPGEAVRLQGDRYLKVATPEQWDDYVSTLELRYRITTDSILFTIPSDRDQTIEFTAHFASEPLVNSANTNPWLLYGADMLIASTAASILADMQMTSEAAYQETKAIRARKRIQAMGFGREWGDLA